MDLLPTSEQQQIIDSASAYIRDRLPIQRLKALDRKPEVPPVDIWNEIADLGWLGLGLEPSVGGVGYGPCEEVLLFREAGRAAFAPRMLFSVMAAHAAAAAGEVRTVQQIVAGQLSSALAVRNVPLADGSPAAGGRLYECIGAQLALIIDADEVVLFDLSALDVAILPCLDTSLSMAAVDLSALPVLARVSDPNIGLRGTLLQAAYEVGLAERALDMIVEYAKIRHTFGRPIGAYQAVRHPCAEMAARAEEARGQVFLASVALADGMPDAALQISAARVLAGKAALQNTDDNIQLHGGIGVTDEFDAHFLMKRATVSPHWFGDRRSHLDRVLNTPLNSEAVS